MTDISTEMAGYYARRAAEYDAIYRKPERQADLRAIEAALPDLFAGRRGLEIACGTAWWTPFVAQHAAGWLATDLASETLALARARSPMPGCVRFAEADAYALEAVAGRFDAAFAGCWWSHVLLQRLPAWLASLHARLEPGARVVFLDNRYVEGSSTPVSRTDAEGNGYQTRRLADGSTHEVLKNFPGREQARAALGPRAIDVEWIEHAHYWLLSYRLN